jgi:hypothetical protein
MTNDMRTRIITRKRAYWQTVHKGCLITITRDRRRVGFAGQTKNDGQYRFHIDVRTDAGNGRFLYNGYAPITVRNMRDAHREAIAGAQLDRIKAGKNA